MGNNKLESAVMHLKFHVARISHFSKAFICCLVPPSCFSSSRIASHLSPKKTVIIHWLEFKNPISISQTYRRAIPAFKRQAVQFLAAKNLIASHLPLEALPAVRTWCVNCKRDRKTVLTWHFAVCFQWRNSRPNPNLGRSAKTKE